MTLTNVLGHSRGDTYYIYFIECSVNKKKYVGRTKTPRGREMAHLNSLRGNRHSNPELQKDFNKCGEQAFNFEIIDTAEDNVYARKQKERFWMETLKTYNPHYGYNNNDVIFRRCTPI